MVQVKLNEWLKIRDEGVLRLGLVNNVHKNG